MSRYSDRERERERAPRDEYAPVSRSRTHDYAAGGEMCYGISDATIAKMKAKGVSAEDVAYAERTKNSVDRDDVARHREWIKDYNRSDPWHHGKGGRFNSSGRPR